ncbi:uncharacterized protein K452DRAFT_233849 [Aplosporella prunicola CBS 121167]|uniref:EthD domain-containing protein n=1 Tax=Aplosporella prunicola CBS 121167 TaxID=1176127 RepID=A0A6A6B323_9PEZI|nr:uncharacterized protein K452DRAFT_233849 [Aplosporella prunicola CBS 121167]KAF2138450.1 hypothetical protein K452DRAFT_233849 [Aplosporella prunicola CBS 121167]
MPVFTTILYPSASDATFDLDYYLNKHMPMVQEHFGPHGMKGWKVQKLVGTASGKGSPYSITCALEFGTKEEFDNALKAGAEPVMADIPNFSNKDPIFLVGEQVGASS